MQPFNFVTMTQYAGRNAVDLSGQELPAYATFNQVRANGGKVKKGAKGYFIFCGFREKTDEKGKTVTVPRSAYVFHIDDCELDNDFKNYVVAECTEGRIAAGEAIFA